MTTEKLREMLEAKPFRSLNLQLADGRQIRIDDPEFVHPHPRGHSTIVFYRDDTFDMINMNEILRVDVEDESQ